MPASLGTTITITDEEPGLWDERRVRVTLEIVVPGTELVDTLNAILGL